MAALCRYIVKYKRTCSPFAYHVRLTAGKANGDVQFALNFEPIATLLLFTSNIGPSIGISGKHTAKVLIKWQTNERKQLDFVTCYHHVS